MKTTTGVSVMVPRATVPVPENGEWVTPKRASELAGVSLLEMQGMMAGRRVEAFRHAGGGWRVRAWSWPT